MKASAVVAFLSILASGSQTVAQTVATTFSTAVPTTCRLSKPARVVTSIRGVPGVAAEFRRQKIDIADVGEKPIHFDVEDKLSEGLRRFVRAYVFKDRTIVWYYRGGFGVTFHVVELRMQRDTIKDPLLLHLTGRNLGGPLCAATEAILAGVGGQQDW